jgi:hypothetical protein
MIPAILRDGAGDVGAVVNSTSRPCRPAPRDASKRALYLADRAPAGGYGIAKIDSNATVARLWENRTPPVMVTVDRRGVQQWLNNDEIRTGRAASNQDASGRQPASAGRKPVK